MDEWMPVPPNPSIMILFLLLLLPLLADAASTPQLQRHETCQEHLNSWVEVKLQEPSCVQLGAALSSGALSVPPSEEVLDSICNSPCYDDVLQELRELVTLGCPRLALGRFCAGAADCGDAKDFVCRDSVCERKCFLESDCSHPLEICDRGSCRVTVFDAVYPVSAPLPHVHELLENLCMRAPATAEHPSKWSAEGFFALPQLATCQEAAKLDCGFPALQESFDRCPSSVRPKWRARWNQIATQCAGRFTSDTSACAPAPPSNFLCPPDRLIGSATPATTGASCTTPEPVLWGLGFTSSRCELANGGHCPLSCTGNSVPAGNLTLTCEGGTWISPPEGLGTCVGAPCDVSPGRSQWPELVLSCPGKDETVKSGQLCQLYCAESLEGVVGVAFHTLECHRGTLIPVGDIGVQELCGKEDRPAAGESKSQRVTSGAVVAIVLLMVAGACVLLGGFFYHQRRRRRGKRDWASIGLTQDSPSSSQPTAGLEDDGWQEELMNSSHQP